MDRIKVSVIGLRGHARKHIDFLKENRSVILHRVYYHKPPPSGYRSLPITGDLADCLDSDLIIVSSPTSTHLDYIKALIDYQGYIFLEKPAVNRGIHVKELLALPERLKSRIRINFNFLFNEIAILLDDLIHSGQLGKIFSFDLHSTHGAAFRDSWDNAWRIDGETGFGPLESTGIHYIHFALRQFGKCIESHIYTSCLSGKRSSIDTGILNMKMENDVWIRIRHSYAAPYAVRMEVWGTEGYFLYNGDVGGMYYPRDTYDQNGLFSDPPLKTSWKIDFKKSWAESLQKAQDEFIQVVQEGRRLDSSEFDRDVTAIRVLLDGRRA